MALDSKQKRMSAIHVTMPWRGGLVDPAESWSQVNQQAAAFLYSGILAATPVVPPPPITDTIITQGGPPLAARTINVLEEQLGQLGNSGTLRRHSVSKAGRLLGVPRRLGQ